MGIKVRSGDVAARIRQTRGFNRITKFGKILSTGIDRSNIAINTFTNTLKNSLSNLKAYSSNVVTSKAYLDVVRAQTEVILSEMGEMKQLAMQSQNASATNRLALQASLASKQKTIARKLANAEFGGISIFTNYTFFSNEFVVGNGLNLNADIDAVLGVELINSNGICSDNFLGNRSITTNTVLDRLEASSII